MPSLVAGSVTIANSGAATITPAGCLAGVIYAAEIDASDEYTTANGGTVPDDKDRVKLLRWYALRSTKVAAGLCTFLNANL